MNNEYKAVIVAIEDFDLSQSVLFAKRSDSEVQTRAILMEEILRLMNDFDQEVKVSVSEDDYGETVITAIYNNMRNSIKYKVCLEEHERKDDET